MAYGTIAGIQNLISDIVDDGIFTSTTRPSLATAQQMLDAIDAILNVELEQEYYVTPVADVDSNAYKVLAHASNCGAAARVMSTLPRESYQEPFDGGSGGDRREMLDREFFRTLKRIQDRQLKAPRTVSEAGYLRFKTKDTTKRNPFFTRDRFDYPGSRSEPPDNYLSSSGRYR